MANHQPAGGGDPASVPDRVVVCNPNSGSGDHADRIRELAEVHGFETWVTEEEGDGVDYARRAGAEGAEMVAAAGGDGTVNEVVRGLVAADALADTAFGVLPAGTGNNFAGNVGITDFETGFARLTGGPRRRIDLGMADDRPFVNSCVVGLTAEASASTSDDLKASVGVLAYVLETLELAREFDGLDVRIDPVYEDEPVWEGEAEVVLIGNARRFPASGRTQANVEDGLLDVTIVEQRPRIEEIGEAAITRLLGSETEHVRRLLSPALDVAVDGGPATVSLDGELVEAEELSVRTDAGTLEVGVGDDYVPDPDPE